MGRRHLQVTSARRASGAVRLARRTRHLACFGVNSRRQLAIRPPVWRALPTGRSLTEEKRMTDGAIRWALSLQGWPVQLPLRRDLNSQE
jgi:hypothetical protein